MMQVKILVFGILKEITGSRRINVDLFEGATIADLYKVLYHQYPAFSELKSLMVAVNEEYAEDKDIIQNGDEIALIPPVSGG